MAVGKMGNAISLHHFWTDQDMLDIASFLGSDNGRRIVGLSSIGRKPSLRPENDFCVRSSNCWSTVAAHLSFELEVICPVETRILRFNDHDRRLSLVCHRMRIFFLFLEFWVRTKVVRNYRMMFA